MKYLIYILAIIILLGINIGLFNNLQFHGILPNLLFLLTVYFALEKSSLDFLFIAFICGMFLDFFGTGLFGAQTLALLVMSLCLHALVSTFLRLEQNWQNLSWIFIGAFAIYNLIVWVFELVVFKLNLSAVNEPFQMFVKAFLPGVVYNLLLLYPIYFIGNGLKTLTDNFSVRRRSTIR